MQSMEALFYRGIVHFLFLHIYLDFVHILRKYFCLNSKKRGKICWIKKAIKITF